MNTENKNYDTYEKILKHQQGRISLLEDQLECSENYTAIWKGRAEYAQHQERVAKDYTRGMAYSYILVAVLLLFILAYQSRLREENEHLNKLIHTYKQIDDGNRKMEPRTQRK